MDWTGVRSSAVTRAQAGSGRGKAPREKGIFGGKFMSVSLETAKSSGLGISKKFAAAAILLLLDGALLPAQEVGGEANLNLPDLSQDSFLGINRHQLLLYRIVLCVLGFLFGFT